MPLACFHTLVPSLHSSSYISLPLSLVGCEATAAEGDICKRLNITSTGADGWVQQEMFEGSQHTSKFLPLWVSLGHWVGSIQVPCHGIGSTTLENPVTGNWCAYLVLKCGQSFSMHWRLWNYTIGWRYPNKATQYDLSCDNHLSKSRQ